MLSFNFKNLILVAGLVTLAGSASADSIYDFTGYCSDCYGGAGSVTAVLDLSNSNTTISSSNFVSFTYSGSNIFPSFTISNLSSDSFVSGSVANLPGTANVEIDDSQYYFDSYKGGGLDGQWYVGYFGNSTDSDTGVSHNWAGQSSGAPEPSTMGMIAGALVGIVFFRRRLLAVLR